MQTKKQNRTGDCSITGIVNKAKEIYKKSNVKNPLSTGNKAGDYVLGKTPLAKNWNKGFNIGKGAFIVKQTYDETCRTKKKEKINNIKTKEIINEKILQSIPIIGRILFFNLLCFKLP